MKRQAASDARRRSRCYPERDAQEGPYVHVLSTPHVVTLHLSDTTGVAKERCVEKTSAEPAEGSSSKANPARRRRRHEEVAQNRKQVGTEGHAELVQLCWHLLGC